MKDFDPYTTLKVIISNTYVQGAKDALSSDAQERYIHSQMVEVVKMFEEIINRSLRRE